MTITAASTSTGPFTATFTFDEAVTGFASGDITVSNGAPSNLQNPSSDNQTFTATITPVATGDVTLNVSADVAMDEAGNGNTAATQFSSSYTSSVTDTTAPTVTSIVRQDPTTSPTNADTLTWRVTFNEDVKDIGDADFAIAGTTASLDVTAMTGSTSVYDVTASGGDLDDRNTAVTLSFATGQDIKDNANNNLTNTTPTVTDESDYVVDNTAPTAEKIERHEPTTTPTNADSLTWRITFSEDVQNVSPADFTVTGTNASRVITRVSNDVYQVSISSTGTNDLGDLNGTVTLSFSTGLVSQNITDPAGNDLVTTGTPVPNDNTYEVDNTAPTVTITDVPTDSTGAFPATFTFNEAVNDFIVGDITVGNGTAAAFTGMNGDTEFTAQITPTANGTVTVDVAVDVATDPAGNGNTAATRVSSTYMAPVADTTAPRVTSIERNTPTTSPTNADTLTWRVTFNEDVKDVGDADFEIAGTTAGLTATAMTGSASVYDVTASGGNLADRNATVTLSFATGQDIKDIANNALANTTPTGTNDFTYLLDNAAPTVTITDVPTDSTGPFPATFTFNEAVNDFVVGDITVGNGTAAAFTGMNGDTEFTAQITPTANGTVTVDVAVDVATDPAGNGNTAATRVSSTSMAPVTDTTAPRVTSIERQTPTTTPTHADTLTWRVTFNEDVQDVGDADFEIAGTTAGLTATAMTGSASVYDVTASGGNLADRNATVTLSFATGQDIKDIANNALANTTPTGTNDNTYVVDNTAPTVTITDVPMDSTGPFPATFTFNEAVNDFVVGDITVGNGTAAAFTGANGDTGLHGADHADGQRHRDGGRGGGCGHGPGGQRQHGGDAGVVHLYGARHRHHRPAGDLDRVLQRLPHASLADQRGRSAVVGDVQRRCEECGRDGFRGEQYVGDAERDRLWAFAIHR